MSLRVDDKGRRTRSRSRQRSSRDDRGTSPAPPSSSSKKRESERKTVEIVESASDNEGDRSRQASKFDRYAPSRDESGFHPDDRPIVVPGLSSLSNSIRSPTASGASKGKDSNGSSYFDPPKRDRLAEEAAKFEVRSPKGVEMPQSPIWPVDSFTAPLPGAFPEAEERAATVVSPTQWHARNASFGVPYPGAASSPSDTAAQPRDRSISYTQMPTADYAPPTHYQYPPPQPIEQTVYGGRPILPPSSPPNSRHTSYSYGDQVREVREVRPRDIKPSSPPAREERSHRLSVTDRGSDRRGVSPGRLGLDRLVVSGASQPHHGNGGAPPASPLLEAYHGTYQMASPMPSPMMLAANDSLEDVPPISPILSPRTVTKGEEKSVSIVEVKAPKKKSVKIYDAETDAIILSQAMSHGDNEPLIDILPDLTHDQLLELRTEYKRHCKVQGRGVNIAKHIKVKTSSNFGKICYVTALGRWESEAYWANFWYQSHSSNRELLIEALMGRTNGEIRAIKDSFRDKRYNDSLSKCMEKELKADKFRTAILLALDERRQEETDVLSIDARNRDVDALHRALTSSQGGESAIIAIVVTRSDAHLREVLKTYERMYDENFARAALRKSNNLVGEAIAHILNGAINRPARDTLLLRHALRDLSDRSASRKELRYELLTSRLVRLHWDRLHLARVRDEYRRKYGADLVSDVRAGTRGEYGAFCVRLCSV